MRTLNKTIWPYKISIDGPRAHDIVDHRVRWLIDNMPTKRWYVVNGTYYFKREKDMTWFLLSCGGK